jgi:hypothetical protein
MSNLKYFSNFSPVYAGPFKTFREDQRASESSVIDVELGITLVALGPCRLPGIVLNSP